MVQCKNCKTSFTGNYCFNCGQKATIKRFSLSNLSHEFIHGFFHFHRGFLFTAKELFMRPAITIEKYLDGERINYFNPFTYLVLVSFVSGFLHAHSGSIDHPDANILASTETIDFSSKYFSVRLLLTIPIYALIGKLIYFKHRYNLAEHFIINTYIISQIALLFGFIEIVPMVFHFDDKEFSVLNIILLFSFVILPFYVFYELFRDENIVLRIFRALATVTLGLFISFAFINLVIKGFFGLKSLLG